MNCCSFLITPKSEQNDSPFFLWLLFCCSTVLFLFILYSHDWLLRNVYTFGVRSFGMIWSRISDPRSLGSCCFKGTNESVTSVDSSVPLMHPDPNDLVSLTWIRINPKERTLGHILGVHGFMKLNILILITSRMLLSSWHGVCIALAYISILVACWTWRLLCC